MNFSGTGARFVGLWWMIVSVGAVIGMVALNILDQAPRRASQAFTAESRFTITMPSCTQ